jgi:hypothetical protein
MPVLAFAYLTSVQVVPLQTQNVLPDVPAVLEYRLPGLVVLHELTGLPEPTIQVGTLLLVVNREYPVVPTASPKTYIPTCAFEEPVRVVDVRSSVIVEHLEVQPELAAMTLKSETAKEVLPQELGLQIWTRALAPPVLGVLMLNITLLCAWPFAPTRTPSPNPLT